VSFICCIHVSRVGCWSCLDAFIVAPLCVAPALEYPGPGAKFLALLLPLCGPGGQSSGPAALYFWPGACFSSGAAPVMNLEDTHYLVLLTNFTPGNTPILSKVRSLPAKSRGHPLPISRTPITILEDTHYHLITPILSKVRSLLLFKVLSLLITFQTDYNFAPASNHAAGKR
jgi:hypothetical protein